MARLGVLIYVAILVVVQGCYTPFDVSFIRQPLSVGVVDDKIIFAGGNDQFSDRVEIYDVNTKETGIFALPAGRFRLSVAGSGSTILFAGGLRPSPTFAAPPYPFIDVLNMDTLSITVLPLPTNRTIFQSVVVGTTAYFFGQDLVSFDMETFNITLIPTDGVLDSAVTDGSTIFFLNNAQRRIDRFDPQTGSWSVFRTLDSAFTNILYNPGRSMIVAYGIGRIIRMPVYGANTNFEFVVAAHFNVITQVPVMIGDFLYLADRRSMVVHDLYNLVSFRMQMSHLVFSADQSAAVRDGIIYYTGSSPQLIPVLTFDTRAAIQHFPMTVSGTTPFTAGDLLFWYDVRTSTLTTYNLATQETNTFPWALPRGLNLNAALPVSNKLLTVSQAAYDTFNVDTQELTSRDFPSNARLDFFWSQAVGDYAVFLLRGNPTMAHLYDGRLDTWTLNINTTQPLCIRALVVDTKIVFSCGVVLEVYDIESQQWLPSLLFGEDSGSNPHGTAVGSTAFFAGGPAEGPNTRVYIYNTASHELKHVVLPQARQNMNVASANNNEWVVFFGGSTDGVTSTRVDLYNIQQDSWKSVNLPPISTHVQWVRMANTGNFIAFGRGTRIDVLDLTNFGVVTVPHTFGTILSMVPLGSKIICSGSFFGGIIDIAVYETSTQTVQTIEMHGSLIVGDLKIWRNIVHFPFGFEGRFMIPLSATFSSLQSHEIFSGFATNFTLDALGIGLSFNWRHNSVALNAGGPVLQIPSAQRESEGMYEVHVTDQCSQRMVQQARLTVNGPPVITVPLQNTVLLCHETQNISTHYRGKQVSLSWTISNTVHSTSDAPYLTVASDSLACNTDNAVCVTALNPAGAVSSCSTVRFVEVDRVFQGPLLTSSSDLHFIGSLEDLQISIKEDWCTSHTWFADGKELMTFEDTSSKLTVNVTRGMEKTRFYVIAQCGNNQVRSEPFVFGDIAPLELWLFVLIVVLCSIALIGAAVVAFLGVKRLRRSAEHETELQTMLSQAKTESLQKDATPIIQATKWEWTPTADFTYKSINSLPFSVDTSMLQFGGDSDPLEVDMVAQNDIIFSLGNNSKAKKQLKQPLLNNTHVDIYVPISPKYEITVEPTSFELSANSSVHVAVSVKLRMTTHCKITLVVVLEQQNIYSAIEFKLASKMSTWIDLEEIEMNGEFLGGGGFGSVVRGVYRGQDVAVKKLLSQYLTDDMKIEFEREVTLMKSLRHPNIVQFVGASNVTESLALVIEYAPLGSLASVMEKQSLSVQFKVQCLLETAKALQFLHSNGIIHRDIKPQNILVFSLETRAAVHVKLTDFGTSRYIANDPTTITKNVGTISYMAPEALGRNPRIDKSADVYSFALLMWSVLFEQVPFKDFQWDSDIEQHVKLGNRLPFPHGHEIDPLLVKLIEECWQHDPKQRPTMSTVVQRLSSLQM